MRRFFVMSSSRNIFTSESACLGALCAAFCIALFFTGIEGQLFFLSQLCLWLALFLALLNNSVRIVIFGSPFFVLLVLAVTISALSILWSPVPGYTQTMVWRQSSVLIMLLTLVFLGLEKQWSGLRLLLFGLAIALLVGALIQYLSGGQAKATFLNKNSFAGFLLPLLFWALLPQEQQRIKWIERVLLVGCGLVIGLIGSRGALLAIGAAGCGLWVLARCSGVRLRSCLPQCAFAAAGLLGSVFLSGLQSGAGRLATLADPYSAGASRFYIWQASWQMLQDAPWYGTGSGLYGLLYPPYRLEEDRSAGHFVHHDLLQIFIENGWPGGILAVALGVALGAMIWRGLNCCSQQQEKQKLEIALLVAGLGAVAVHSLFTFNFYVYSTLLLCAVVIARIHILLPDTVSGRRILNLRAHGRLMPFVPALLCLFPLFLLLTAWWSQMATDKALDAVARDDMRAVVRYLNIAKRMWPSNDFNWYMEGELLRIGLKQQEAAGPVRRKEQFKMAVSDFNRAFELNPYRVITAYKLGLLWEMSGNSADVARAADCYRIALGIDPRYIPARLELAGTYAAERDMERVQHILESGLRHYYPPTPEVLTYLQLTRDMLLRNGENEKALKLDERITKITTQLKKNEADGENRNK